VVGGELSGDSRTLLGMEQLGETDAELWDRCRQGDADALGGLFDRHADAVFRYCLSRSGSWQDAEDIVSVTFLEAWRQRTRLTLERKSILPWLLGVATNSVRNRARSVRRHEQFLRQLPHAAVEPDHSSSIADRVDAENLVKELLDGAGNLTRGERDALLLCTVNGYSYLEAAEALQVRVGTIRSRVNRAKTKLRAAAVASPLLLAEQNNPVESRQS